MAGARSLNPPVLHTVQMLVMMIAATMAMTLLSGLAIVTEWSRFWFAVPFGQACTPTLPGVSVASSVTVLLLGGSTC